MRAFCATTFCRKSMPGTTSARTATAAIAGNPSGGICAVSARSIQPRALTHRQLHQHSVEARCDRRRQRVSVQDPQGAETEYSRLAAGRNRGSGERARKLAAAEPANGELAQEAGLRFPPQPGEWHI